MQGELGAPRSGIPRGSTLLRNTSANHKLRRWRTKTVKSLTGWIPFLIQLLCPAQLMIVSSNTSLKFIVVHISQNQQFSRHTSDVCKQEITIRKLRLEALKSAVDSHEPVYRYKTASHAWWTRDERGGRWGGLVGGSARSESQPPCRNYLGTTHRNGLKVAMATRGARVTSRESTQVYNHRIHTFTYIIYYPPSPSEVHIQIHSNSLQGVSKLQFAHKKQLVLE